MRIEKVFWQVLSYSFLVSWLILVPLLTGIAACSRESDVDNARSIANKLVYTKDNRTGLCFAIWEVSSGYRAGITEVPCDKVQNELDK
jgi:hypothetical protein